MSGPNYKENGYLCIIDIRRFYRIFLIFISVFYLSMMVCVLPIWSFQLVCDGRSSFFMTLSFAAESLHATHAKSIYLQMGLRSLFFICKYVSFDVYNYSFVVNLLLCMDLTSRLVARTLSKSTSYIVYTSRSIIRDDMSVCISLTRQ